MKTLLSFIRWKFVIPVAIFVVALFVFFLLFFDPLLERGLEAAGAKINGAKVDVSGLNTKIFKGRLTIQNIQVSDRKQPMTNRVEAGPLVFEMAFGEILRKRVVIPESRIDGIQFGTTRKTSGALPKRKQKEAEKEEKDSAAVKLVNKYKNRFKLNLDGLKNQVDEKIEFDPKDLEVTRQAEALKEKANVMPIQWEKRINDQDYEGRLKKVEADTEAIKNTPTSGVEAITGIPKALDNLKKTKKEIDQIKKDVAKSKSDLQSEIKNLKSEVKGLKGAKKKDLAYLESKMNLEFANPERLVEGLIGGALLNRIQQTLRFVEMARKHLPSKKEKEALPRKPRAEGMDIEFPHPAAPPRFWLKESGLSGTVRDIAVNGELTHLTSDPPRVGKPLVLSLAGKKGVEVFSAKITADHTGEEKKDSFVLEARNLQVKKMAGGGVLGEALTKGTGNAKFVFYAKDEKQIGGHLTFSLSKLGFHDETLLREIGLDDGSSSSLKNNIQAKFITNVARAIEKMKKVEIKATLFGSWEDPDIKITSNLAKELSKVLKNSIGSVVKDQRKELEAKLNKILNQQTSDVNTKITEITSKLGGDFAGLDAKIKKELERASGIKLSPTSGGVDGKEIKIPNLGDIFK